MTKLTNTLKVAVAAVALLAATGIATPPVAEAHGDGAAVGAFVGGAVLGGLLAPRPYYYPAPVYAAPVYPAPVYPAPVYAPPPRCFTYSNGAVACQ
jgi:hypothetical protein